MSANTRMLSIALAIVALNFNNLGCEQQHDPVTPPGPEARKGDLRANLQRCEAGIQSRDREIVELKNEVERLKAPATLTPATSPTPELPKLEEPEKPTEAEKPTKPTKEDELLAKCMNEKEFVAEDKWVADIKGATEGQRLVERYMDLERDDRVQDCRSSLQVYLEWTKLETKADLFVTSEFEASDVGARLKELTELYEKAWVAVISTKETLYSFTFCWGECSADSRAHRVIALVKYLKNEGKKPEDISLTVKRLQELYQLGIREMFTEWKQMAAKPAEARGDDESADHIGALGYELCALTSNTDNPPHGLKPDEEKSLACEGTEGSYSP